MQACWGTSNLGILCASQGGYPEVEGIPTGPLGSEQNPP
jgi:hypothetical protein